VFPAILASLAIALPLATQAQSAARQRVIVAFKHGADAAARADIARHDGRIKLELREVHAVAVDLPARAVAALKRSRHIAYVEADTLQYAMGRASPSAAGQTTPYGITMVQADLLPDTRADNRKVCIIDSGYELAHEDLAGNHVAGENLTSSGDWSTDESHHGTHVGGTISALNNTLGVVGVLPNARLNLYIVKVFDESGSAPSSVIAQAMLRCGANGANVTSCCSPPRATPARAPCRTPRASPRSCR
jgi:subtilisin family serine protease